MITLPNRGRKRMDKRGFTLVELIVVIAILGILAMMVVPSVTGYVKQAQDSTNQANAQTLYNAGMLYVTDLEAGGALPEKFYSADLRDAGYIQQMPKGSAEFEVTAGSGGKTTLTMTYTVDDQTFAYPSDDAP